MADISPSPPVDRRAERRDAIIASAARLFAREGYANCEMEQVACELGIAKGTLYLYFKSKEALFYACVDAGMRQLQAVVTAEAGKQLEPRQKVSNGILAYLRFFEEHPEHVELLIQERANFRDRQQPTYFTHREASRARWREVWASMLASGQLRQDLQVEQILDFVGNLIYGTMFTSHFLGRSSTEQHAIIMDIFFRGVLSDQERNS
jgi:AcrR family transcriptional regulator